ncbi:MAG: ATP-binding protein [Candidatus Acidiferrum sp.]
MNLHREVASKRGHLQESLTTYTRPHVLLIDEVGYLTYGPEAANVLFHVVNDRHLRKRPMIFTTNKPLNEWGKVLHDEDMAAAILDRVLERGRYIHLDGPSGRTRHLNLEETLPVGADRARISGISGSEFPEPTTVAACRASGIWTPGESGSRTDVFGGVNQAHGLLPGGSSFGSNAVWGLSDKLGHFPCSTNFAVSGSGRVAICWNLVILSGADSPTLVFHLHASYASDRRQCIASSPKTPFMGSLTVEGTSTCG